MRLDIRRIEAAVSKINPVFLNSPQYVCESLSRALGCRVVLKIETMNPIRCFKGRGIETVLADRTLSNSRVVCASAGNLGQALAFCGRRRGLSVTVAASSKANPSKIDRMRMFGAKVVLVDGAIEEAFAAAAELAAETGAHLIEDSKDIGTCEGAGTIGLELAAIDCTIDAVLIALGAGALATGVGHAMRCRRPALQIVTVQPVQASGMTQSYHAGHAVDPGPPNTIADGVAGRYVIQDVLSDLIATANDALLVSEDGIKDAIRLLYRYSGLIVEPAAALGVAAIVENRDHFRGMTVATILGGSNISHADFETWALQRPLLPR